MWIKLESLNLSESEKEDFEERAAIAQFDGGLSKEQAESLALKLVLEKRFNKK